MLCGIAMMGLSACSDFFEPDNNTMLKGDDYIKEASEMYAGFLGVATKMQAIGDKAIYGIEGETAAGQIDFTQLVITTNDASPVKTVENSSIEIVANNGLLMIDGVNDGTVVELFNLTGSRILAQPLTNSQVVTGNLRKGIYIVKINNKATKVLIP